MATADELSKRIKDLVNEILFDKRIEMAKQTIRARLYLSCIHDWKAPFEVARLLGDTPPLPTTVVRHYLLTLVANGLAEYHEGNDTFRVSNAKTGE